VLFLLKEAWTGIFWYLISEEVVDSSFYWVETSLLDLLVD
jgi:hypothetical protein